MQCVGTIGFRVCGLRIWIIGNVGVIVGQEVAP